MSKFEGLGLDVDRPGRVLLKHPITGAPLVEIGEDGKEKPDGEAYVLIYSTDSPAANVLQRENLDRRIRKRQDRPSTAAEMERDRIEVLAALTTGWRLVHLDGKPLNIPFDKDAARELYALSTCTWLREQVENAIGDRSNFFSPPPSS